jgi:hypothetical protein
VAGIALEVPPLSSLAAWAYRLVARNRHRLSSGVAACRRTTERRSVTGSRRAS